MKRVVLTVAILLGLAAPAWAGFDEGVAAYERGDYATALREFRPFANQGYAAAQFNLGIMYDEGRAFRRTTPRPSSGIARPLSRAYGRHR